MKFATKGSLHQDEPIYNNEVVIGKILIEKDFPFALVKYLDKNFDKNLNYSTKKASFKIIKPSWIKF